jgi:selenocysteine lyase/cysteine desulfurase
VVPQIPAGCALAVFDAVTSNSGMVLPVAQLVAAARAAGAGAVLVDGAHSLGAFDLDLPALGADYFVSNCHKWLCSSRGLGMLYARQPSGPGAPRPAVISHGFGAGFASEFIWDGARDYSAAVALPTLLEWWRWVGEERARAYCRGLLVAALELLGRRWGVGTHVPLEFYSHMGCIQLPAQCLPPGALLPAAPGAAAAAGEPLFRCTATHSKMMQDALHHACAIEVPAKTLPGPLGGADSRTYLRISAFVYNSLADYERLAEAVLGISWEAGGGEGEPPRLVLAEGAGREKV